MRISDWSSDVCSSDLTQCAGIECLELVGGDMNALDLAAVFEVAGKFGAGIVECAVLEQRSESGLGFTAQTRLFLLFAFGSQAIGLSLGSASCRERVCQSV